MTGLIVIIAIGIMGIIIGMAIYEEINKFKFKYLEELDKPIELTGSFIWNEDELRYEIDIYNNDKYICLSYLGNGQMYDFEILKEKVVLL